MIMIMIILFVKQRLATVQVTAHHLQLAKLDMYHTFIVRIVTNTKVDVLD